MGGVSYRNLCIHFSQLLIALRMLGAGPVPHPLHAAASALGTGARGSAAATPCRCLRHPSTPVPPAIASPPPMPSARSRCRCLRQPGNPVPPPSLPRHRCLSPGVDATAARVDAIAAGAEVATCRSLDCPMITDPGGDPVQYQ